MTGSIVKTSSIIIPLGHNGNYVDSGYKKDDKQCVSTLVSVCILFILQEMLLHCIEQEDCL